MIGEKEVTLIRMPRPTANGDYVFRREGHKASVYMNKRMFKRDTLPDSITISAGEDVFRLPGNLDSDALTKRVNFLKERAARKSRRVETERLEIDDLHDKVAELHAVLDDIGE